MFLVWQPSRQQNEQLLTVIGLQYHVLCYIEFAVRDDYYLCLFLIC